MIEIANIFYFVYITFLLALFLLIFLVLKNRTLKTQKIFLFSLLALNFSFHFLKLLFNPYFSTLKTSISTITFENLCSVSTIFFPLFFVLKKENSLHDFMFFIGVCSGLAAILLPFEPLGKSAFNFDVIRFYFCHFTLFSVPLLSALLKIHTPKLKNFWIIPIMFFGYETLIFFNELFLVKSKIINISMAEFFDRNVRNISFVFGPTSRFDKMKFLLDVLVPKVFKTTIFGIETLNGEFYFPVLWMAFPVLLYFPPIYALLCSPFLISEKIKNLKEKNNMKKNKTIKAGCILISKETKKIGLVFREKLNDYEFAKGHLEKGETIPECAVRETAEETKRIAKIVEKFKPLKNCYTTPTGEKCESFLFIATDEGKSDNDSTDTHELVWADIDEVDNLLKYDSIKKVWKKAKKIITKNFEF